MAFKFLKVHLCVVCICVYMYMGTNMCAGAYTCVYTHMGKPEVELVLFFRCFLTYIWRQSFSLEPRAHLGSLVDYPKSWVIVGPLHYFKHLWDAEDPNTVS